MSDNMAEAKELARLLLPDPKTSEPPRLLQGVIASIERTAPANRLTATIFLSGSTFPIGGIRYLDSYSPKVNDTVWLMKNGPDLIIIGKLDRSIGSQPQAKRFRGTSAERTAGTLQNLWGVVSGDEWYETDTQLRYTWSGSAWVMTGWPRMYGRVFRGADQNLLTGWNYPAHDGVTYNVGGLNVGWHIIAPVTGWWHLRGKYCIVVANNPQTMILASEIGGSLYWRGDQIQLRGQASGDIVTMHYDETHWVTAGQAMYMRIYNGSANTCVMFGAAEQNHFAAEFEGA